MGTTAEGTRLNKMADQVQDKQVQVEAHLEMVAREQKLIGDRAETQLVKANKKIEAIEFRLKPYVDGDKVKDDNFDKLYDEYYSWLKERKNMRHTIEVVNESLAEIELGMTGSYNANTGKSAGAL